MTITLFLSFGAANALSTCNKEAAKRSMTFTLFDKERHFLSRPGWRDGVMHRLS
jgi:hypothetical protein